MDELDTLVARYGVKHWVGNTYGLIALVTSDGQLLACNPAFTHLRAQRPLASRLSDFLSEESRPLCEQHLRENRAMQSPLVLLLGVHPKPVLHHCWLVPLPDGQALFFAEPTDHDPHLTEKYQQLLYDHQRLEQALHRKEVDLRGVIAQAHEISHTDSLTFLPNRRKIIGDLQHEVLRTNRYHTPLSIAMLDIDHFKIINDTYGHPVGDEVLRALSSELRENVREPDLVGRIGGEEFLIVLPNTTLQAAAEQSDRLCKQIRQIVIPVNNLSLRITVSIGVTEFLAGQESWQSLLSRADEALYRAKNNGRDQWYVLSPQEN
ncbi:MAG: GGDEF domain-containing protein [Anaerolineae bacterium]